MASRDEIDRVRSAVNILDVVAPYVALKRSGAVWKGLCPFHSEKTPSFQVTPERNRWWCFGSCSTGGDAFNFLEKIENLSFFEALERLAQMTGITLSKSFEAGQDKSEREKQYHAIEVATQFYQKTLQDTPAARKYLLDRGIVHESQVSFRLGVADDSYDALPAYLRKNGVDLNDAAAAGVLTRAERQYGDSLYDKLRGRIICPILDVHDRPIAFGGRLMEDAKDRPKYINTAETKLFSKGRTFFAMSRARKTIGDLSCAIVVEGYFDVISAHQAGFTNVVATLGTALTPDHAEILRRYADRVVLAFDSDSAGLKAAHRAAAIFEAKEFETLVLDLPQGEDPDSILRSGRISEFQRAIDNACPIREFQLKAIRKRCLDRHDLTERDKVAVLRREVLPILRGTKSVIERESYVRLCAPLHPYFNQSAAIAEDQIRQEVAASLPAKESGRQPGAKRNGASPAVEPPRGLHVAQENVLRAIASDDAVLKDLVQDLGVGPHLFVTEEHAELARRLLAVDDRSGLLAKIALEPDDETTEAGSPAIRSVALRLLAASEADCGGEAADQRGPAPNTAAVVKDSVVRLQREQALRQERQLRLRVDQGDSNAAAELMRLIRRLHGTSEAA